MRLDHFIAKSSGISERSARELIASGKVSVDFNVSRDLRHEISQFSAVSVEGQVLQKPLPQYYLMLNKPVGILSATVDEHHETVLDLIDLPDKGTLHLAGRLDRSSSGLILLTNDGRWSEKLTEPDRKVAKVYEVKTDRSIPPDAIELFDKGFHFPTEGITTRPAMLELLSDCSARVTLQEGRYHQIKRMFHRIDGIKLLSLHRIRIGGISLPEDLMPGEWKKIDPEEAFL